MKFASSSSNLVGRILHHEWVVNGKVVSSKTKSSTSLDENLHTVIFLHGLLGNGKVCSCVCCEIEKNMSGNCLSLQYVCFSSFHFHKELEKSSKEINRTESKLESFVARYVFYMTYELYLFHDEKSNSALSIMFYHLFSPLYIYVLDLRGHGQSSSTIQLGGMNRTSNNTSSSREDHTIQNCALDIMETAKHLNLTGPTQSPIGIVGHSFGGRCALQYLSQTQKNHHHQSKSNDNNIKPPKFTWLLDTVPGQAHSSVSNVIQALRNIDVSRIKNKQELVQILTIEEKIEKSIAQWMTTNLKKKEDGDKSSFEFMFDLDVAIGVLNDFPKQNFMQLVKDCTSMGTGTVSVGSSSSSSSNHHNDNDNDKVYLVMGGKNKSWTDEIVSEFKWLENNHHKMELVSLPKAGHWVHVDDLDGLMDVMNSCFRNI